MTTLREAAQQALECLKGVARGKYDGNAADVCAALEAALAQQAEPAQEPYTGDVTRIMRDAGMTLHLGLPHKAVVEQMTRGVDLVYAEASIKAAQQFSAALAQQAKPVWMHPWPPVRAQQAEPVSADPHTTTLRNLLKFCLPWEPDACVLGNVTARQAVAALRAALAQQAEPAQEPVAGRAFLERILTAMEGVIDVADRKTDEFDALRSCVIDLTVMLHAAPPQRKPLPKHDQHCVDVPGYGLTAVRLVRAVERAHGIT